MNKSEKTKQSIIEKSAPLFNTRGVSGTAVADVMKVTGLARGSLYVHFKDMEELSHCAVDWNLNLFMEKIAAEAEKYSSARDKFFGLLDYLGDPLNPPVQGGCPMMNFGMEADDTSPVIRDKVNNTICAVQQGMLDILKAGIEAGEFRQDWDYTIFVVKAYAMIEGGILVSRVTKDNTQMQLLVRLLKEEVTAAAA